MKTPQQPAALPLPPPLPRRPWRSNRAPRGRCRRRPQGTHMCGPYLTAPARRRRRQSSTRRSSCCGARRRMAAAQQRLQYGRCQGPRQACPGRRRRNGRRRCRCRTPCRWGLRTRCLASASRRRGRRRAGRRRSSSMAVSEGAAGATRGRHLRMRQRRWGPPTSNR
jgi:hypothetical protein